MSIEQLHWSELDKYFTFSRRTLAKEPSWRYGAERVFEVANEGYSYISKFSSFEGKRYCDLGCGIFHPFGVSAIMFLNGAISTLSLDLEHSDHVRAAEALFDLLSDCLVFPEKWNWSNKSNEEFISLIRRFNLTALKEGKLVEGLSHLPMAYVVTDIHNPQIPAGSIDVMTSRAVLEHFLDFGTAVNRLFEIMSPGGIAFHSIDLVDHRAYENNNYHYFSFLSENKEWSDGVCNRLRSKEIRPFFENTGFEILMYEERSLEMPIDFENQISPYFLQNMSIQELCVTGIDCVIRRP